MDCIGYQERPSALISAGLLGNEFNKESLKSKNAGMLENPQEGKPKVQ